MALLPSSTRCGWHISYDSLWQLVVWLLWHMGTLDGERWVMPRQYCLWKWQFRSVDQWRGPVSQLAGGCARDKHSSWDCTHPHSPERTQALHILLANTESTPPQKWWERGQEKKKSREEFKHLELWMWCLPHDRSINREQKLHWLKRLEYSLCPVTADH